MTPASPNVSPAAREAGPAYVGVIDIGSNSVRLVVYDGLTRAPAPVFNERVLCGLGRSISTTGRLDPEGIEVALNTLRRFQAILDDLGAELIDSVATAAVRDATDGGDFEARLKQELGLPVRVLSGIEEARVSALGVVSGSPGADGVMGDLGGGSLELIELDHGEPKRSVTLPLGSLRLRQFRGRKLQREVDSALADVDWLDHARDRTLFAVGGSWRSLARLHIAQTRYPVSIVHNYVMNRVAAEDLTGLIAKMSRESLDGITGVPRRRVESLPATAMTMLRLLQRSCPREVVFSAFGVREGLLFERLAASVRGEDPLLAGCRQLIARDGRGFDDGEALWAWLRPLFGDAVAETSRLCLAACTLRDVAWRTNSDYRADEALTHVIRAPFTGIDHPGRIFLGLTLYARYGGDLGDEISVPYHRLVDERASKEAHILGAGLRLASTLAADGNHLEGVGGLRLNADKLVLALSPKGRPLYGDLVSRRLAALARAIGCQAEVADKELRAS